MSDDVVALERMLLDPAVRGDPTAVARLLHPDFTEIGASGRRWTRESLVAALQDEPAADVEMADAATRQVADGVVLLTYVAAGPGGRSHRSSLWVRDGGDWKVLFHQGTPA